MKVYIKYGFVFEPAETWDSMGAFHGDLAAFFQERGLEAEVIETAEGQEQLRILFIKKAPEVVPEPKPVSKQRLKAYSSPRDGGRFTSGRSER